MFFSNSSFRHLVYYGTEYLGEVHREFDVSPKIMVNTGGENRDFVKLATLQVESGFSLSKEGGDFKIVVTKQDNTTTTDIALPSETGKVPQVICVDGKWAWPTETTSIDKAYKDFGKWGANYAENTNWHNVITGPVINK